MTQVLSSQLVKKLVAAGLPEDLRGLVGRKVLLTKPLDLEKLQDCLPHFPRPFAVLCIIREVEVCYDGRSVKLHFDSESDENLPPVAVCHAGFSADTDCDESDEEDGLDWEIWPGCRDHDCEGYGTGDGCTLKHFSYEPFYARMVLVPES